MHPIVGKSYETQGYGRTGFAGTRAGAALYKAFGGIHPGRDFGTGGINLPVRSTVSGKVVRASMDGGWGNHVEVQGQDGWRRQYAHLSAILVAVGDAVTPGTVLGKVGTTGSSTAVHLHYGNRKPKLLGGWEYRDPASDLDAAPSPAPLPKSRLIRESGTPGVYVWNGKLRHGIPDWETKEFLFGKGDGDIEEVAPDVMSKLPEGQPMPSLR